MNEHLWLTSTDPLVLLAELYPMTTLGSQLPQTRRSRMYLLACARRHQVWRLLPNACRAIVALGEVYADAPNEEDRVRAAAAPIAERLMHSEGTPDDLAEAESALATTSVVGGGTLRDLLADRDRARPVARGPEPREPLSPDDWRGLAALVYLPFELCRPAYTWVPRRFHSEPRLREVHGNPCRLLGFDPSWRTDVVLTLARQAYESHEFGTMPILADALQDAGCENDTILAHCRDRNQVHVRGCWVLDLILERR